MQKIFFKR